MAVLFVDSSALVKRYVAETGSTWLTALLTPDAGHAIHIAAVTGVELVAAFARRQHTRAVSEQDLARATSEFRNDWNSEYELVRIDRTLIERAMSLAQRHGLRGYDAVQLASAIDVESLTRRFQLPFLLVSADDALNAAASAEHLPVENPNLYP